MFEVSLGTDATLRLLEERHSEALLQLIEQNRERLRVWVPWLHATATLDMTRDYVRQKLQRFADGNGFGAGIWFCGALAGEIGLDYIDHENQMTEIGYWVDAGIEGRGVVTRACQRLVTYAFDELELNRVQIRCATENTRSRAVAERLGFVQEGVLRQVERLEDRSVDLVIYGILADEWRVRRRFTHPLLSRE